MDKTKKVLLLIEDNPLLTGLYKTAFEKEGLEVLFAHDGETGIALAKEKQPNAILLDLLMPGIDGLEVLKKIKSNSITKKIMVIILTIVSKEDSQKKAKDLGAEDYLIKSELELNEIVNRVLEHLKK